MLDDLCLDVLNMLPCANSLFPADGMLGKYRHCITIDKLSVRYTILCDVN